MDVPNRRRRAAPRCQERPLKADATAQVTLLDVQELDSRADQLRHQRRSLPEIAQIDELQATRTDLEDQARDARIVADDLSAEQKKVDADVEQVKARRARDRHRMDTGQVGNPKDLERLGHELESLERRITSLEDDELEVMERLEEVQSTLDSLAKIIEQTDVELGELLAARDEKVARIDAELAEVEAQREPAIEGLPEDLLALYEKLRAAKGGVGAAKLHQRRCTGCQLGIDNAELAVIRVAPADLVVRCEECSRILVRTAESGL